MRPPKILLSVVRLVLLCMILASANFAFGQASSFTYQGRLQDGGTNANGSYDFQFTLWDAVSGGIQQPQPSPITVTRLSVSVANGTFTVQLDFGASAFPGADRFLEIGVRPAGGSGLTILSPRQPITSTPYATRSLNATSADNVTVSGIPAGSSNYIQNTTAQQPSSNFNISGGGVIGGNLAVGTSTPNARLHVVDNTNVPLTTAYFQNLGTGDAVRGQSPTTTGTLGTSTIAVFGGAISPTGSTYGVWGQSQSNNGIGVRGWALSTTGTTIGVEGRSESPDGVGVVGSATEIATGLLGTSVGGRGVIGRAVGVSGWSLRPAGVWGDSSTGVGVYGSSGSSSGVEGTSTTGNGVLGTASSGGIGGSFFSSPVAVSAQAFAGRNVYLGGGNLTGSEIKFRRDGVAHYSIYNDGNLTFANTSANFAPNTIGTPLMVISSTGNARIANTLFISSYVGGQNISLCTASSGANANLIGLCSSSLTHKTNVRGFRGGMNIINRLRPITFDWKESGARDLGLAAEEVEQVEPLLTFRNDKGVIEGVKYNQLSALFINAFKEQQAEIQQQQEQLKRQQEQINRQEDQARQQRAALASQHAALASQQQQLDALKRLVCRSHRRASVCKRI